MVCARAVRKGEGGCCKSVNVTHKRRYHLDFGVVFHDSCLILKINWAVTLNEELLLVDLAYRKVLAHFNHFGELVAEFTVDNWECVYRNQNLVTVTMNPD